MQSTRLYAVVLRLGALRKGAVPAHHEEISRGALMRLIQKDAPELSQAIHDSNQRKPYTVSPLSGGKRGGDGAQHFGEGTEAEWRFTLLGEPQFEALLQGYLRDRSLPHVRLGHVEFAIHEARLSGAGHPESGHISPQELHERWNCPPEKLPRLLGLDFRSPTTFKLGTDADKQERYRPNPDPRTVFSTLRKRWEAISGLSNLPGDEFDEWVGRSVELEPHWLKGQTLIVKGHKVEGFMGQARYRVYGRDVRWLPLLHLLSDLTFWTGVGYQTTCGYGQTRRMSNLERAR